MPTFVVSHDSEFISCLIALCIQLYFGRNVRIHIISVLNSSQIRTSVVPWCGVSTISSFRGNHWDFFQARVLRGVLRHVLLPLVNVHLSDTPRNRHLNPDLPPGSQLSKLVGRVTTLGSHSGLLYHPSMLLGAMKSYFAHSSHVSFASVVSTSVLPSAFEGVADLVTLIRFPSNAAHGFGASDMLIQSKLSSFEQLHPIARQSVPKAALWIPLFRAIMGTAHEPALRCQRVTHGNVALLDFVSLSSDQISHDINHLDLIYCFKICDYVLDCLEESPVFQSRL